MTTRTADEAKAEYISKMGPKLGEVYHHLWQEVAMLYQKWEEYLILFGTKPARTDLLNEAAPRFFWLIQESLWDDILLHIARLDDPPRSAGKDTLSVRRLPNMVASSIQVDVTALVAVVELNCEFCRDWRNRRIAHNDLDLRTNATATPLAPASRLSVDAALKSLADVLDAVSEHYTGSTSMFTWGDRISPFGATALLYVIDDGLRADKESRGRWERGEIGIQELQKRHADI